MNRPAGLDIDVDGNIWTGTAAVLLAAVLGLGAAAVPEIGFVLQGVGVGGIFGLLAAYRAKRLGFEIDPWLVTARWSIGLLCLSIGYVIFEAVF